MRRKMTWSRAAAVLVAMAIPVLGRADDSFAPCWRNGLNTTFQSWTFAASNNPAVPDLWTNPNGTPTGNLTIGAFGKGWLASSFGGKTGLWELGRAGQVSVIVPNFPSQNAPKYVQVQVSYFEDTLAYRPPVVSIAGAMAVGTETVDNLSAPPGMWRTQKTLWLLNPSPSSETVLISGDSSRGLLIDQVVIDTRIAAGGDGDVPAFRPCWRGSSDATFQHWSFGVWSDPSSVVPELFTNAFGIPGGVIIPGAFSSGYIDEDEFLGCRQGIWDLGRSGTMTLTVPNTTSGSPDSCKYLQLAVTQFRDGIYNQNAAVAVAGGVLINQQQQTIQTNDFGGIWVVQKSVWRMGPPSPAFETVTLTGGTNGSLIDQIVIDTLPVEIVCPSDVFAMADPGHCSKSNVTWTVPEVDGCVITNVTCVPALGSTFPVGKNLVTCTVRDGQGGIQICGFMVMIGDNQAPTIACPSNIIAARNPALCGAVVNFTPAAFDNCSATTVVSTPPSGSVFPLGLTTVTSVAYDTAGNASAPCSFTVQVIDLTGDIAGFRPCWRGIPGSTFQHWAFGSSNNPAAIIPDLATNVHGVSTAAISPGAFSSGYIETDAFLGCRQGIWDLGEEGTMTLSIPDSVSVSPGSYRYVQVAVTQFRDGIYNQNASVAVTTGSLMSQKQESIETNGFGGQWIVHKSVWRIAPGSGLDQVILTAGTNGSLIDQIVIDTLPVNLTAPTDILASADAGHCGKSNVVWTVPAVDGCVITNVTCVPASGSAFSVGTTPVSCTVFDGEGGSHVFNFTVTIADNEAPVARGTNMIVHLDASGNVTITAADLDAGSSDNCGIASREISQSSFSCANLGSNQVVLTVTDIHGLANACDVVVTVLDTLPPSISPVAAIVTNAISDCSQVVIWETPGATDNCSVTNVSCVPASGSLFPVGTNTVVCTAYDASGNAAVSMFNVVVVPQADISVAVAAANSSVIIGSKTFFNVTVDNHGPCAALGVVLSNSFPPGLISLSISNGAAVQANPWPGPAAWWRAENNASDAVGVNHGTLLGSASYAQGEVGQAFRFDGLSGVMTVPDSAALRPANLTIEGWIRIQDVTGLHVILGKRIGGSTMDSYSLWIGSGVLYAAVSDGSASAPFMSFPEFPTSSAFGAGDIVNLGSFASRLQNATPADPVPYFIRTNLSVLTADLLAAYTGGVNMDLQGAIATDLNEIIANGAIYDAQRFAGVTLSPESEYVLGRNPQGLDLVRLNRFLIRDAFPAELASVVFPQLNQRFHVAYTFDSSTRIQALYVNGALVNAGFATNDVAYDSHDLIIGGDDDNGTPGYFFQGDVDELAIYNRALSGTEIRAIFQAHSAGKWLTPGVIAIGSIPANSSAEVALMTLASDCSGGIAMVSATSATLDLNLGNNDSSAAVTVNDLPDSQFAMGISRVSGNNHLIRLTWPLTCTPAELLMADEMNGPVLWSQMTVPTVMLDDRWCTILPGGDLKRYFRVQK